MKIHIINLLLILFMTCFLFSCRTQIDSPETNNGYLAITIPQLNNSKRSIFTSQQAENLVNHYAIYCWTSSGIMYTEDSLDYSDTLPKLSLPENAYNVLVIAGYNKSFLGSGFYKNAIIENNKTTEIEISLFPIEWETSLEKMSDSYEQNEEIELSFSCDKKGMPIILYAGFYHIYTENNSSISGSNTAYPLKDNKQQEIYKIKLPSEIGNYYITTSTGISINDEWISTGTLTYGKNKYLWQLNNENIFPDTLNANFLKKFTITQKYSGLKVNIKWARN